MQLFKFMQSSELNVLNVSLFHKVLNSRETSSGLAVTLSHLTGHDNTGSGSQKTLGAIAGTSKCVNRVVLKRPCERCKTSRIDMVKNGPDWHFFLGKKRFPRLHLAQ